MYLRSQTIGSHFCGYGITRQHGRQICVCNKSKKRGWSGRVFKKGFFCEKLVSVLNDEEQRRNRASSTAVCPVISMCLIAEGSILKFIQLVSSINSLIVVY